MSALEKSDLPEVARKRANKAVSAAAELVERRGGAKENADLQSTVRTQSREAVSQAQARIREAVIRETVPRHHPRWEPGALAAPAGICAGGGQQWPSLVRCKCPANDHFWRMARKAVSLRRPCGYLARAVDPAPLFQAPLFRPD